MVDDHLDGETPELFRFATLSVVTMPLTLVDMVVRMVVVVMFAVSLSFYDNKTLVPLLVMCGFRASLRHSYGHCSHCYHDDVRKFCCKLLRLLCHLLLASASSPSCDFYSFAVLSCGEAVRNPIRRNKHHVPNLCSRA